MLITAERLATCTTNSPGSMVGWLSRPMNENASAGKTNVCVTDLPGKIEARAKPFSILTSGHTLAYESDRYYGSARHASSARVSSSSNLWGRSHAVPFAYQKGRLASFDLARVGDRHLRLHCLSDLGRRGIELQVRVREARVAQTVAKGIQRRRSGRVLWTRYSLLSNAARTRQESKARVCVDKRTRW